jgi:hypothetical protein
VDKEESMIGARTLAVVAGWLLVTSAVSAQTVPARFRWQPGQVLDYKLEQVTNEIDVVGGTRAETSLKLNNIKRWTVLAVDAAGVATVQQSLTALRIEKTSATGASVVYDSAHPDQSDSQMREQLSKYVGVPLAVLRIDGQGRVVEVKESKFAPASRYENALPFTVALPAEGLQQGKGWERRYQITLEPGLGTGEKYPAVQQWQCKEIKAGMVACLALTTALQAAPADKGDEAKLAQFQPCGEVSFDLQAGRMMYARMTIDKEIRGHQGEDSSYRLQSRYSEEYLGGN